MGICTHRAHGYVQAGILSVRTGLHGLQSYKVQLSRTELTAFKVPKHGPVMGSCYSVASQWTCIRLSQEIIPRTIYPHGFHNARFSCRSRTASRCYMHLAGPALLSPTWKPSTRGLRYVWPLPVWDPDPPVWRPRVQGVHATYDGPVLYRCSAYGTRMNPMESANMLKGRVMV